MMNIFGLGSYLELGKPSSSSKDVESVSSVFTDMVDPLLDEDSEESKEDRPYQYKAPTQCPTWLNILCIVFAVGITGVAVGVYLAWYYGFRNHDDGFTKDTLWWSLALAACILASMCCISFGVYCLIFRAECWTNRKNSKRVKEHATQLAGLKARKRQRWEAGSEVRGQHDVIRDKYGIRNKNPLDNTL